MSLQTSHSSQHNTFDTHARNELFSRASTRSRHFSSRARRDVPSGERAGFDAGSTTVKPSFDGYSRRRSLLKVQEQPAGAGALAPSGTALKTGGNATLERLARFPCGLDGGMEAHRLHAAVLEAMAGQERHERERVLGRSSAQARERGRKWFLWHPLRGSTGRTEARSKRTTCTSSSQPL